VLNSVSNTRQAVYRVLSTVSKSRQAVYRVGTSAVTASRQAVYRVLQSVSKSRQAVYRVGTSAVTASRQAVYRVLQSVSASRQAVYRVLQSVSKSRQAVYHVLQSVSKSRQAVYVVSHPTPIPTNFIRTSVAGQKNLAFSWNFSGQTKYQLQIDDYVSGSVVYDSGEVVSSAQTKLLAWADRLPPGTYYAYLWCWDADGQKSEAAVI